MRLVRSMRTPHAAASFRDSASSRQTLPSSGCFPLVQATTRLCSGTLPFNTMARLCAVCRKTLLAAGYHPASFDLRHRARHHRTNSELRAAAEEGCQMCVLLWRSFSAIEKSDLLEIRPARAKRKLSGVFYHFLPVRATNESNRIEFDQGSIRTNQIQVQNSSIRTNQVRIRRLRTYS
jgi:hypothetical protein